MSDLLWVIGAILAASLIVTLPGLVVGADFEELVKAFGLLVVCFSAFAFLMFALYKVAI